MSQEDNGNGMSSYEGATGKTGGEDSSLAARRARLRGTLAKQTVPPDPYVPDPYMNAQANQAAPAANASPVPPAPNPPSPAPEIPAAPPIPAAPALPPLPAAPLPNHYSEPQPFVASEQAYQQPPPPPPVQAAPPLVERRQRNIPQPAPTVEMSTMPDMPPSTEFQHEYHMPMPEPAPQSHAPEPMPQALLPEPMPQAPLPEPLPEEEPMPKDPASSFASPAPGEVMPVAATQQGVNVPDPQQMQVQTQALELLNNIDQAMGACAMNLSGLQKLAGEQAETMRQLAEKMGNQSFFEIGLNLNSLAESLSAALEPMKAVGELVPAIDQLVTVLESRAAQSDDDGKLSPDQLVTSLADQLSNGMIDPWTFKCAYMAVYPADHPADLLHRLVDLLGTQRLSGDLFRAAYDAVQAAEAPIKPMAPEAAERTIVKVVPDETMLAELNDLRKQVEELDVLRRQNDDLKKQNEQQVGKTAREEEFVELLASKEHELQEAQELLNSRWEEFNTRYDELTETLQKRDEMIQEKESELSKKESENQQLRAQVDELRDQTKEMFAEMQKQLMKPKEEPQAPAAKPAGFFDPAPSQQPQQAPSLFEAAPGKPLFQPAPQPEPQPAPVPQPQPVPQPAVAIPTPPQPVQPPAPPTPPAPPLPQPAAANVSQSNQAVPKPTPQPTTPFMTGAGSYGSGVRAQVFEVIVRQALAGAPWREICAGPMQVNNITAEEVEAEVKRRQALLGKK